ncbi:IS110 family transposase [Maribacter sp.]|uniref:IS110 family transposase n=1 Tax=Maribacter sp. TaxID=1897614 RepID=UPI003C76147F
MFPTPVLRHCIGVDVSKDSLSICSCKLGPDLVKTFDFGEDVGNDRTGFDNLLDWIRGQTDTVPPVILMEATGVYHEGLAHYLFSCGIELCIMQSGRVKRYAQSLDQRSKTDMLDSKMLSMLGCERLLKPWSPPSENLVQLKGLCRERAALVRERTLEKNRLHALKIGSHQNKRTLSRHKKRLKMFEEQIAEVVQEMHALINADDRLSGQLGNLISIPGVSFVALATVVGETLGFSDIANVKQLASFAGYDVVLRESSNFRGRTRISKKGNKHIRAVLHMPSMAVIGFNPTLGPFYQRLKAKKEKPIVGLIATQRKLLLLMYALWKKEEFYDPDILKNKAAGPKEPSAQDSNLKYQLTS